MPSNLRMFVFCPPLVCLLLSGCGGGSAKPPAGVQANPVAAQQNPGAAPAPGNQGPIAQTGVGANQANANGSNAGAAVVPDEEELTPPGPDEFEIAQLETVTEITGTQHEPPPEPVEALPINSKINSSTLEIVDASEVAATPNGTGTPRTTTPNGVASPMPAAVYAGPNGTNKAATATESSSWNLPEGVTAVAGAGTDPATGLPLRITVEKDPVEMVLIPPGVFLEGIDGRDPAAGPQHSVLLESPYYIDVTEVTIERYDAFREFLRKTEGRKMDAPANAKGDSQAPAVGIKFFDAKYFAKWAGKELPTEAQWERAARGDHGFEFPWGNGRPIFHQPRLPGQLDPVATYPGDRSPFGVYDTAGNAREWCLDWFSSEAFQKQAEQAGGPVRNPTGPRTSQGTGTKLQVVKGGKADWSVWQRAGVPQNEAPRDVGFRCVINIASDTPDAEKDKDKGATGKGSDKPAKGADKKKKAVGL